MILCAITNRIVLAETEAARTVELLALALAWASTGVHFIQLREKDLPDHHVTDLAAMLAAQLRSAGSGTKLLINSRPEVAASIALASGADGVHLPGRSDPRRLSVDLASIKEAWQAKREPGQPPIISISCHSAAEVAAARAAGATLALFAPVFEKPLPESKALAGQGLESLATACRLGSEPGAQPALPVLALGGVTLRNASQCMAAGAVGIAAIRLFLDKGNEGWRSLSSAAAAPSS